MRINLKNLLITAFVFAATNTFAQVGIGTNTPAASAALEVASNTNNKGILIPRITATQKDAISNPAEGLMIYQTSTPVGFYYFTNNSWRLMVTQTDLDTKVTKLSGKELSSNDYTSAEKTKLANLTGSNTGDQDLSALATITSVALKANTADVNTAISLKANAADLTSGLALKVNQVNGKELSSNDYTTVEKTKLAGISGSNTGDQDLSALATIASVALKANIADVNTDLALKANSAEVSNSLALKSNITDVNTALALKANTAEVTNSLALKANITDLNTALALKAPLASPTLVTPNIGVATGTSLSVSGQLTSTIVTGTAPLVVSSTTPVANLSIGGNAATATLANTVITNANLNGDITSIGNATTIGASKVTNAMLAGSIDLTNKVTGVLPSSKGGTGNGFAKITGPATSEKTFTLPNASATILTSNAAVSVAQGGTGLTTTPLNGQIDIGNGSGFNRTTISAGSGISVSNAAGEITIGLSERIGFVPINDFNTGSSSVFGYNVADFKTIFLTSSEDGSLCNLKNLAAGMPGQVLNLVFAPSNTNHTMGLNILSGGSFGSGIAVNSTMTFSTTYGHGGVILIFDGRYWRVMNSQSVY
jgi:hypothetical protein